MNSKNEELKDKKASSKGDNKCDFEKNPLFHKSKSSVMTISQNLARNIKDKILKDDYDFQNDENEKLFNEGVVVGIIAALTVFELGLLCEDRITEETLKEVLRKAGEE